ncbi:hypothetical protein [Ferrovibrio sp.]|uniref:hypothetical protein n=1 Tax=Ferrovibrio sp. TaxID=1917215 RepID=UPI00312000A2
MTTDRTLRLLLRADGVFCILLALPCLLASAWLAGFLLPGLATVLTVPTDLALFELGMVLAGYGALMLMLSMQGGVSPGFVAVTAAADAAWVFGTILLLALAAPVFSGWGIVALAVVAADTGLLGVLKARSLRGVWQAEAGAAHV